MTPTLPTDPMASSPEGEPAPIATATPSSRSGPLNGPDHSIGNARELALRVRRTPGQIARHVAGRVVYWTPVFAALALFAQVAYLGLRPALSEGRRLADASDMLEARWQKDQQLYDAYELQLRAREDPIFRERQRRVRLATAPTGG